MNSGGGCEVAPKQPCGLYANFDAVDVCRALTCRCLSEANLSVVVQAGRLEFRCMPSLFKAGQ